MSRTIRDANVERFHYDSHDQLQARLTDCGPTVYWTVEISVVTHHSAHRLKAMGGLTPRIYI